MRAPLEVPALVLPQYPYRDCANLYSKFQQARRSVRPEEPMTQIGLNATVMRTDASYHNAGPSRYTTNLVAGVLAQPSDYDFTIYVNDQVPSLPFKPTRDVRIQRTPIRTSRTGLRILWELMVAPWQIGASRLDLVHSMLNVVPLAAPTRHVVTIHDLSFMRVANAHPPLRRWYLTAATWLSIRRSAAILADSKATRNDVIRLLGANPDRVHVVYPGSDPSFHPRPDNEVEAFRTTKNLNRPFVLFVGTLEPRKNVDILITAFGTLVRQNKFSGDLVIVGGTGWGTRAIDAALAKSPIRDRIKMMGYVNQSELPSWYTAATLVVYPSSYEGFGIPVLAAMASGTPVITSNQSSLPEVGGNASLTIEPRDALQLADAMTTVLASRRQREEMRSRGLAQAQRFDWGIASQRCLNVYRKVLNPS